MNQNIREKATAILDVTSNDVASNKGREVGRPCPACGMMMALPESSAHRVNATAR
jgi:hypothetical protein